MGTATPTKMVILTEIKHEEIKLMSGNKGVGQINLLHATAFSYLLAARLTDL